VVERSPCRGVTAPEAIKPTLLSCGYQGGKTTDAYGTVPETQECAIKGPANRMEVCRLLAQLLTAADTTAHKLAHDNSARA
jgi:hypothetical protein